MHRRVLVFAVLSLLFAADADAATRYGGDRVLFRAPVGRTITAGPVLTTAANDRAAIAWASSGRVYVVTEDRGRLGNPVTIPVPETARTLAVDVNARGDVAVAMAQFTGRLGDRDSSDVPCCVDAWVAIRRAGEARFRAPRPVIRRVLGVGPRDVGVRLSPRGRVAVWYDGQLRYTLASSAKRYAAAPSGIGAESAGFDGRDRLFVSCEDGSQTSSFFGHHLGSFEWPFAGWSGEYRPRVWTDRRGRQIAVWDQQTRDYWGLLQPREVWTAWRRPAQPFRGSHSLGQTDAYGSTYAMGPDGSGAVAHTLRALSPSTSTDARVVVLPVNTSGHVGKPQTLAAGDSVQLASIAVDRGRALVSWTAKGAGDDHVPWWRLINLDGSATPPARVLSSRYASPLRLGLTRSYGLAVWEQSGPGAPIEEIHVRHLYR